VWLVSLATGEASRVTRGDWSVATSLATSPLSWSADGRTISFVRFATPHSGDTDQSAVWLVDAATGAMRGLTGRTAREGSPLLSPDGARVAYTFPRDGDPANVDEVDVAPAGGGEGRAVTRALDRHVTEFAWLGDGRALLVLGTDRSEERRVGKEWRSGGARDGWKEKGERRGQRLEMDGAAPK